MRHIIICIICIFLSFPLSAQDMKFIENKGQWGDQIKFRAELPNGYVFIREAGITVFLLDPEKLEQLEQKRHRHIHDDEDGHEDEKHSEHDLQILKSPTPQILDSIQAHAFHIDYLDFNPNLRIEKKDIQPEKINYLIGKDRSKWGQNISPCKQLIFHDLYEGIDLKLSSIDGTLKYEYHIAPGVDYKKIKFKIDGANELNLANNALEIKTSIQDIYDSKPFSYQLGEKKSTNIPSAFVLNKTSNIVSFKLKGNINKRLPLVIDPQLIFSTYSGSLADHWGNTACVDIEKNLYAGGTIFPTTSGVNGVNQLDGFPATTGAFQSALSGGHTDIGIMKFDSAGTSLLYATYIGGNDSEIPTSIVTNDNGDLYILGISASTDYPVQSDGFDITFNGGNALCGRGDFDYIENFATNTLTVTNPTCPAVAASFTLVGGYSFYNGTDIVVTKLNNDGSDILSATYIGGSENDGILWGRMTLVNFNISDGLTNNYGDQLRGDIILDEDENVYIASTTSSGNFPIVNGVQSVYGGGDSDACVMKLDSGLTNIQWSTFLGGVENDASFSIQNDSVNNVVITGGTTSDDFPVTTGTIHDTVIGETDGYVTWLQEDGTAILHSTRLGTSEFDQGYFVQLDNEQNVYILGQSKGDYLKTDSVYFNENGGVFIHKMNYELDSTYYSTIVGDTLGATISPNISPTAFLINECENIFISGWGGSVNSQYNGDNTFNMPLSSNAFQTVTDGSDFYLMVLRSNADSLIYATYFGGFGVREHVDGGTSRFDKEGIVYQSVCAGCGGLDGFPTFPNPGTWSNTNNSDNCNNGVFKFDLANLEADFEGPSGCIPLNVTFVNNSVGGSNFIWDFGDGKDTIVNTASNVTHVYDTTGTYIVKLYATDITTCVGIDSMIKTFTVNSPALNLTFRDTTCQNSPIELTAGLYDTAGINSYSWSPTTFLDDPTSKNPIATPTSSIQYLITMTDSNGCQLVDTFNLSVVEIDASFDYTLAGSCTNKPQATFSNTSSSEVDLSYLWTFGDGNTSTEESPLHQYSSHDTFSVVLKITNEYCSDTISTILISKPIYIPNVITPNGDDVNDVFIISNIENNGDWNVDIYNRWGDPVYRNEAYSNEWGATNLNPGLYYYLITAPNGEKCKGWIEVLR